MTLQNMNQLRLVPRKDYVANRLLSGALQLAANTSLYLDETQLEQGQQQGRALTRRDLWAEDATGALDV